MNTASMTNPTQRFFTVVVTGCKKCPHVCVEIGDIGLPFNWCSFARNSITGKRLVEENFHAITPSCAMYPQSQEVEK